MIIYRGKQYLGKVKRKLRRILTLSKKIIDNEGGYFDGVYYRLWKTNGSTKMNLGKSGRFRCRWKGCTNVLFRAGIQLDKPAHYKQFQSICSEYNVIYKPKNKSFLAIYGWSTEPLIEYYIIESWRGSRPDYGKLAGSFYADDSVYDVFVSEMKNMPSIAGVSDFLQYRSVRREKRERGTVNVFDHFKAWEQFGLDTGNVCEITMCVEGMKGSGNAGIRKNHISIIPQQTGTVESTGD